MGPRSTQGLSLIELMIAMVLGLLVTGSAIGVFLSNQQTYRSTESLARIQESARIAFEMMAREMREAGGNACSRGLPVANVLENPNQWWSNWSNGLQGYDNGSLPASSGASDAVELVSGASGGVTVTQHNPSSAQFKVSTSNHGFESNDILVVCDYTQAAIFQVTNANPANVTIVHNSGGGTIGNCTKSLGLPLPAADCAHATGGGSGSNKTYGPNSQVIKLRATRWYVADNGRGGRSLYRLRMDKGTNQVVDEITEGISDMQITYLVEGANQYVDSTAVADWSAVVAARIQLQLEGTARVGTDGQVLGRELQHVVNLRNRTS